jgi:hypothetical protein
MAFSPQVNYIKWVTATGRRILMPILADRGVSCGQCGGAPTVINLSFLDRSHYFLFQVAPHLCSWGWVDPVPDPLLLRKSGSTGNPIRDLCICSQELWPLDHRGGCINTQHSTEKVLKFLQELTAYWINFNWYKLLIYSYMKHHKIRDNQKLKGELTAGCGIRIRTTVMAN